MDYLFAPRKSINPLNLIIGKGIDYLNLPVGKRVNYLPLSRFIRKSCDFLDLDIGEGVNYLYFYIGESLDELDSSVEITLAGEGFAPDQSSQGYE